MKKLFSTHISANAINFALLILRVSGGVFMLTHGWPKFNKVLDGDFKFGDPLGIGPEASLVLAMLAEFFGSILIILGLGTRFASLALIITMIVAGFIRHAADPFATKEKALLYLLIFTVTLILGAGKYSLDRAIERKL